MHEYQVPVHAAGLHEGTLCVVAVRAGLGSAYARCAGFDILAACEEFIAGLPWFIADGVTSRSLPQGHGRCTEMLWGPCPPFNVTLSAAVLDCSHRKGSELPYRAQEVLALQLSSLPLVGFAAMLRPGYGTAPGCQHVRTPTFPMRKPYLGPTSVSLPVSLTHKAHVLFRTRYVN